MEERADYRLDGEESTIIPEGKLTPKQVLRREETIPCTEPVAFMLYPKDNTHDERCVCSKHLTKIVADGDIVVTGDIPEGATCAYHYPTITESGHCMWCAYPVDSCMCDALGLEHEIGTERRTSNAKRFVVENGAKQVDIWADWVRINGRRSTYDISLHPSCTDDTAERLDFMRDRKVMFKYPKKEIVGTWPFRKEITKIAEREEVISDVVACFAPAQWTHWFLADDPNYGGIPS